MLADRMLSLKLDPAGHPITDDTVWRVMATAIRAIRRRVDVHLVMRLLFLGWFAAMAVAPRAAVEALAEPFIFPSKRAVLNPLLARLHSPARVAASPFS